MKLSYRADGRLREAELHDVDAVDVTDCSDHHRPFISVDLERGSSADKMSVSGYLTVEAARDLRDLLNGLDL